MLARSNYFGAASRYLPKDGGLPVSSLLLPRNHYPFGDVRDADGRSQTGTCKHLMQLCNLK